MQLVRGPQPLPISVYTATLYATYSGGCMSASTTARPAIVGTFIWLVVATAVGLTGGLGTVPGLDPLLRLLLVLVPIFAVPLLFATHIALFRRLWPSIK